MDSLETAGASAEAEELKQAREQRDAIGLLNDNLVTERGRVELTAGTIGECVI